MQIYLELLQDILNSGVVSKDRTGTGTLSVFGRQMRFNLQHGFPLLTTKKIHIRSVIYELLWFLKGETNIQYLKDNGITIWDEWADASGELGPVYGHQWRSWQNYDGSKTDQIHQVIQQIKETPDSRRMLVSSWNVALVHDMALPPCHTLFQFYCRENYLSCMLYMRSVDVFLGLPFNIASYALLLSMIAQVTEKKPFELIISTGDTHIYLNHLEQVNLQLTRSPKALPNLVINKAVKEIDNFQYQDFEFVGYEPYPTIKAPISV